MLLHLKTNKLVVAKEDIPKVIEFFHRKNGHVMRDKMYHMVYMPVSLFTIHEFCVFTLFIIDLPALLRDRKRSYSTVAWHGVCGVCWSMYLCWKMLWFYSSLIHTNMWSQVAPIRNKQPPQSRLIMEVNHTSIIDLVDMGEDNMAEWEGQKVRYILSYEDEFSRFLQLEVIPTKTAANVARSIKQNMNCTANVIIHDVNANWE